MEFQQVQAPGSRQAALKPPSTFGIVVQKSERGIFRGVMTDTRRQQSFASLIDLISRIDTACFPDGPARRISGPQGRKSEDPALAHGTASQVGPEVPPAVWAVHSAGTVLSAQIEVMFRRNDSLQERIFLPHGKVRSFRSTYELMELIHDEALLGEAPKRSRSGRCAG